MIAYFFNKKGELMIGHTGEFDVKVGMSVIGIDPGVTGGIVVLNGDGSIKHLVPMPELAMQIADIVEAANYQGRCHVFVEKAQAMPKNGAVGMFNYGQGFGTILGILTAFKVPFTLVPPKVWCKVMHAGAKSSKLPKERSREVVVRLQPHFTFMASERCKKMHEGMIDAYLIAEYGRRSLVKV